MYISKYLALSVIGAILGFIFSIPFGNMLMKSVSDNMLLGNNLGLMPNLTGVVSVVILTIAFAYSCTGKIEKTTRLMQSEAVRRVNDIRKRQSTALGRVMPTAIFIWH